MNQYRVSDAARSDLDEIWFYIANDDPDAADRFVRTLVSRFPMLAGMPEIGRQRGDIAPQLRSFAIGNYLIFYRPVSSAHMDSPSPKLCLARWRFLPR